MFAALSRLFAREANLSGQGASIAAAHPTAGASADAGANLAAEPDAVVQEICRFLADFLMMKGVGPDSSLVESYAFDSFGVQDVLSFLHVRFGKQVEPALLTMADFATPRTIAALLVR